MSNIQENTEKNIVKILEFLKSLDTEIHLRGISKALNMNPFTVSYIIDNYLGIFIDVRNIDQYGFRAKLIKLKPGKENTSIRDVLNYINVKNQIRNNLK